MIKKLASESVVYGLVLAVNQLSTLLLYPLYARLFSETDLAWLVLANTILVGVSLVAVLGLDSAAHRWYWDLTEDLQRQTTISTWFWSQLCSSTFFALLLAAIVFILGRTQHIDPQLEYASYCIAAVQPFKSIFIVVNNWFRMQRLPFQALLINALLMMTNLAITLYLILVVKTNWTGVFLGNFLANFMIGIGVCVYLTPLLSFKKFNFSRLFEMLHYSLPLIPASLAGWLIANSDKWILIWYLPQEKVAQYQVAFLVSMIVGFPIMAFQQAWGPFALSIFRQQHAKQVYIRIVQVFCIGFAVLSVLTTFIALPLIEFLFTSKYANAASTVVFFCFFHLCQGLYYIASLGSNIAKRTPPIALALFVAALVQFITNFLFIPVLGRDGAAIALLLGQLSAVIYLFTASNRVYPIAYPYWKLSVVIVGAFVIALLGSQKFASP